MLMFIALFINLSLLRFKDALKILLIITIDNKTDNTSSIESNNIYFLDNDRKTANVTNLLLSNLHHKYTLDNYSFFCDFNSNITKIFLGTNHKTGTRLFHKVLFFHIFNAWAMKCKYKTKFPYTFSSRHRLDDISSYKGSKHHTSKEIKKFEQSFTNDPFAKYLIMINAIRDPLDTVLSGYNYHKRGDEPWTRQIISKMGRRCDFNFCTNFCWKLVQFMTDKYPQYLNKSLNDIYKNEEIERGLIIEYQRYKQCEYDQINGSYHMIKDVLIPKYENDVEAGVGFVSVRLENFKESFNETLKLIMDVLGVLNDNDRNFLLEGLEKHNIYQHKLRDDVDEMDIHATMGSYNKSEQIDVMLRDKERCLEMMILTKSLDYEWKYVCL